MSAPKVSIRLFSVVRICACIGCALVSVLSTRPAHANTPMIRAAVLVDVPSFRLKVGGGFSLVDTATGKTVASGDDLNATVTLSEAGFLFGALKVNASAVAVVPADEERLQVNDRRYRGGISVLRKKNGRMTVVNRLPLEEYVKGVLFHEASHYWPAEALKAQAIVCRSYAAFQMAENAGRDFDVTSDVYSQVFGGRSAERYRTNRIVDQTRGKVLAYEGKVLPAFFHATCAGHTADSSTLWKTNLPPLKGVACPYCTESPYYRWHEVFSLSEIGAQLARAGLMQGEVRDLKVAQRDPTGRALWIEITAASATRLAAKDFRNAGFVIGFRCTFFSVRFILRDGLFYVSGWGHGVGMCQWGAYFQAKKGKTAEEILSFYYPGAEIRAGE